MELSERELRGLVADTTEQHRDSMKTFKEDNTELLFGDLSRASGRRSFLTKAGLGSVLLTIGSATTPLSRLIIPAAGAQEVTDADIATFAASLEFAAVEAYKAAAGSGKVTTKAVADAAGEFAGHHKEHGEAFKALASDKNVGANKKILEMVSGQLKAAKDETAVVELAYGLENAAASTYLFGLGVLTNKKAYETAASILPVESQHAMVLGSVLGKQVTSADYMPPFEKTDAALKPSEFPVS